MSTNKCFSVLPYLETTEAPTEYPLINLNSSPSF